MIQTKEDYKRYLLLDYEANKYKSGRFIFNVLKNIIDPPTIIQFIKSLRKVEYLRNCRNIPLRRLRLAIAYRRYTQLSKVNGFTIPVNTFGPGLSIAHRGTIVVNEAARIGSNCRLHVCVNIGTAKGFATAAPTIGNNVYIGPGAKIFGPIQIADNCVIGANAVVNKSCLTPGKKLLGVPSKEY